MTRPQALPTEEQRARRDGCGCPPRVVQCAHWDGRVLYLLDYALPGRCNCGSLWLERGGQRFAVFSADEVPGRCHWCFGPTLYSYDAIHSLSNDLPSALRAFAAAEAALIQRGDD